MATTPRYDLELVTPQIQNQAVVLNETMLLMDALCRVLVIQHDAQASPPGSPNEEESWIVTNSPTGAFVGHNLEIATWLNGGWRFTTPVAGMIGKRLAPSASWRKYDGTTWTSATI